MLCAAAVAGVLPAYASAAPAIALALWGKLWL